MPPVKVLIIYGNVVSIPKISSGHYAPHCPHTVVGGLLLTEQMSRKVREEAGLSRPSIKNILLL